MDKTWTTKHGPLMEMGTRPSQAWRYWVNDESWWELHWRETKSREVGKRVTIFSWVTLRTSVIENWRFCDFFLPALPPLVLLCLFFGGVGLLDSVKEEKCDVSLIICVGHDGISIIHKVHVELFANMCWGGVKYGVLSKLFLVTYSHPDMLLGKNTLTWIHF